MDGELVLLAASWDVSCHAEHAWATGMSFGSSLFDLRQCFDRVTLGNLQFASLDHSFPPSLSSVALHQYGAPRVLSAACVTVGWIKPLSGITAGCPLATDVIQCYFATAVNKLALFGSSVRLFVDDQNYFSHDSEHRLESTFGHAVAHEPR